MQEIKPEQLHEIIESQQFKYVELKGMDGKKYGGYNQTPADLKKKVESIKKFCSTVPDGIYYLNFKISPTGTVFPYVYNKGNIDLKESATATAAPIFLQAPKELEKFQTLEEWKRQEARIKELEAELERLKLEITFDRKLAEIAKPEPENPLIGFATNILPMFTPVIEQYMSLKEREISLKEKAPVQQINPLKTRIMKKHPFRPVPALETQDFNRYLDFLDGLNNEALKAELNYLSEKAPETVEWLKNNYFEFETDEL